MTAIVGSVESTGPASLDDYPPILTAVMKVLVVVLLKQRPDLPLLFSIQLQILREASKFLVDLGGMDMLKFLTRRGLLSPLS
jgi:hypothetical protein